MKRPEGFDRQPPAPPAQGRQAQSTSTASSDAVGESKKSAARSDVPKSRAAQERTSTRQRVRQSRNAEQKSGEDRLSNPPTAKPPRRRREVHADSVAAARQELKAAARERRRFERAEMRRFTRRTRRRRITWLTVGGVVVLLAVVLAVAVYSPLLALRTVTVVGARSVSSAQIRSAVSPQLGTPLALLDMDAVRSELGRFTLIRSYTTETVPPSTLVIHITERQPVGVVAAGSTFNEVDAAGVVLRSVTTQGSLPVIDVGGRKPTSAAFRSVVKVLAAMPSSVTKTLTTISATTADDVRLSLSGTSRTVVWGSAESSDEKALALARLLNAPACRGQAVIDVSSATTAVCGPAHAGN